ncbi:hypothetical protein AMTR_s00091p00041340 [Amborella trichopoda]|uniref:Retrotransposon gag domain-containing protein n=1 Tax=Amborella trichopoda TaxID=13333 RepID=W1NT95_AMBTC|nr:hypothetical protein AMTR_s00091p00041340 [Amborella trichopoda]
MKEGKLAEHIQQFRALVQELEAAQVKPDENMQIYYLLNNLPTSWEAFNYPKKKGSLYLSPYYTREHAKLDEIITKLKAQEDKNDT